MQDVQKMLDDDSGDIIYTRAGGLEAKVGGEKKQRERAKKPRATLARPSIEKGLDPPPYKRVIQGVMDVSK